MQNNLLHGSAKSRALISNVKVQISKKYPIKSFRINEFE